MLVLSRYPHQSLRINDDIVVTVLEVRQQESGRWNVRLGIEAPPEVAVHREEIYQKIQAGESP